MGGGAVKNNDFERLLYPRGIAVVGASHELSRIGGQPVRNLSDHGWGGCIYPVNPKYREIKGLVCYPDVRQIAGPCDVAVVAVGASHVAGIVRECAAAGIAFVVVLSAGFGEAGADGERLQAELESAVAETGVRVVGPNCVGVLNLESRMYCGMGTGFQDPGLRTGRVAMVTQSGGVGFALMTLAQREGIGFNYVVSSGNEVDVTTPELLEYFLERDDVDLIATYMEGVSDGRRLLAVGERALRAGKPILVWKSGNTKAGRSAAASHTANLTAQYELYRTAFRLGGFIEVADVTDFVDIVRGYNAQRLPKGANVAVVTTSGGAGVVLADDCEEFGLSLPPIPAQVADRLRAVLPPFAAVRNPLDLTAQGQNNLALSPHNEVVKILLQEPGFDQIVVRNGNVHGSAGIRWADELIELAGASPKPIMASWGIVIAGTDPVAERLSRGGVPCYPTPRRLAAAMGAITAFATKLERACAASGNARLFPQCALDLPSRGGVLGERSSKQILSRYGIPVVQERAVASHEIASLAELAFTFPVAVKVDSPDIPHKTEAGGVRLGVRSADELVEAARSVMESARVYAPGAQIEGILVQEMAEGIETIVGMVDDATFGPTVLFGLGGVLAEVLNDVAFRFAPFDVRTARDMIAETRGAKVLAGYRGAPPADVDALAECLSRVSWLAADHAGRIGELDINPLFVRPSGGGVVAADAVIVLREAPPGAREIPE